MWSKCVVANAIKNKTNNPIMIEVTKNCNLNCTYCYLKDKKIERDIIDADSLASLNKIKNTFLLLTGGEPLTEIDVVQYILNTVNYEVAGIFTNGTLLTLRTVVSLISKKVYFWGINIVGFNQTKDMFLRLIEKFPFLHVFYIKVTTPESYSKDLNYILTLKEKYPLLHFKLNMYNKTWSRIEEVNKKYLQYFRGMSICKTPIFIDTNLNVYFGIPYYFEKYIGKIPSDIDKIIYITEVNKPTFCSRFLLLKTKGITAYADNCICS